MARMGRPFSRVVGRKIPKRIVDHVDLIAELTGQSKSTVWGRIEPHIEDEIRKIIDTQREINKIENEFQKTVEK